jgi:hypothetical protein
MLAETDGLNIAKARTAVATYLRSGSIAFAFKGHTKAGIKTYSTWQQTKTEIWWVHLLDATDTILIAVKQI